MQNGARLLIVLVGILTAIALGVIVIRERSESMGAEGMGRATVPQTVSPKLDLPGQETKTDSGACTVGNEKCQSPIKLER